MTIHTSQLLQQLADTTTKDVNASEHFWFAQKDHYDTGDNTGVNGWGADHMGAGYVRKAA